MDFLKLFGKRVRFLRKANGLSQETFSEKINLHRTSVSRIERGIHFADIETIEEMVKVFGISYSELFQLGDVAPLTGKAAMIAKILKHLNSTDEETLRAMLAGLDAYKRTKKTKK